jgi:class 3 adenylate cyclase
MCAGEVQKTLGDLNEGADNKRPLHFRIGIHVGPR